MTAPDVPMPDDPLSNFEVALEAGDPIGGDVSIDQAMTQQQGVLFIECACRRLVHADMMHDWRGIAGAPDLFGCDACSARLGYTT